MADRNDWPDLTPEGVSRAVLVCCDLRELTDRLRAEGLAFEEIAAGVAAHANEVVTAEFNEATASAWFFGLGKQSARRFLQTIANDQPPDEDSGHGE